MGARHVGNIRELCEELRQHVGHVLIVGTAQLCEFGSREANAQTKGELVESLAEDGTAVLNADDRLVAGMAPRTRAAVTTYGESPDAEVRVDGLVLDDTGCPEFDLVTGAGTAHVRLRLLGEHQAGNAAAAAAVALSLGLGLDQVAAALSAATNASRWRMEQHERADGVLVVNDAYNANPESMRAALKALAAIARGRGPGTRSVAVLGEMRELGESSREEHDAIGRLAVRLDISQLVVVGEPARAIHLGASLEGSWGDESVFVSDNDEATAWLREHLQPGDVVLVKASRAAALEQVAEALLEEENGR
jgi:UDP-N-acetylmuramoyl-tripeptide--D-alanyl-D-alanine ligase